MAKSDYSLVLENTQSNDYKLNPGHTAWVTVGDKSIYITEDRVQVYHLHHEADEPIVSVTI